MVSPDYTVYLEQVFQGPMDLLLHLVREQEVDIHEVEINRVVDGYLAYLKKLQEIDIELAGEFVLMAASLMAIKSRSLLPSEEVDLAEELDPRDELIQRLIEYRRFKEASEDLGQRLEERSRLFPCGDLRARIGDAAPPDEAPTIDFGDLTAWDLLTVYSRLMRETLADHTMRIRADERPMRWYVDQLVGWMKRCPEAELRAILHDAEAHGEEGHDQLIGSFCALLELMRLGVVTADQPHGHGDITIRLRPEHREDVDQIVRSSGFDDEIAELDAPPTSSESTPKEASGSAEG